MTDAERERPTTNEQAAAAALLADSSKYHDHKEQMAYLSAVAYIGAAAALVLSPLHGPLPCLTLGLLVLTAIFGAVYVFWQLRRRDEAAEASQRYYNILVAALPKIEVNRNRFARAPATWLPKCLMMVTMLLWAALAIYHAIRAGCA